MEKILKGYMNDNFRDGDVFLKIMKPVAINYLGIENVFNGLQTLKNNNINFKHILKPIEIEMKNNTVISKFKYIVEDTKMNINNIRDYLEKIINSLNEFHSLDKKNALSFDEIYKMNFFYNNSKVKINDFDSHFKDVENIFKKIRKKYDHVLCHNDVNENNFIVTDKDFLLIDYDTTGLNTKLFDYVSFITETLTLNDKFDVAKEFVQMLIDKKLISINEIDDLNEMFLAQNFLWSLWANYFYNVEKNEIYKTISQKLFSIFTNNKKIF